MAVGGNNDVLLGHCNKLAVDLSEGLAASAAYKIFNAAFFGAGGLGCGDNAESVAEGFSGLGELFAAYGAYIVSVSVLGAGGFNDLNKLPIVTCCGLNKGEKFDFAVNIGKILAAYGAGVITVGAFLGAGSGNTLNITFLVYHMAAERGDVLSFGVVLIIFAGDEQNAAFGAGGLNNNCAFVPVMSELFGCGNCFKLCFAIFIGKYSSAD